MGNNLRVYVAAWVVIAGVVLLLALYRLAVDKRDYTVLHVRKNEVSQIPEQVIRAERLGVIDQWGKILTAVAIAYGLAMGIAYLLMTFRHPSQ